MSEPKPKMLSVGLCRLCETGPLGLRACGGCGRVVVLCDECDALWTTADLAAPPTLDHDPGDAPRLPCPHCGESLLGEPASWASRDASLAEPWIAAAVESGAFALEEGDALGDA